MNIRILMPVALSLALAACSTVSRPSMSYVEGITQIDAATIATDTVAYLAVPLPPAHTTLLLDPPAAKSGKSGSGQGQPDGDDLLTAVLLEKLRSRGYGVATLEAETKTKKDDQKPQGVVLRYLASPLDGGVLLRLQYQGHEASRFYPRGTDGSLKTGTAFTVRGGGKP